MSEGGLITATTEQEKGYVPGGTKSAVQQLTTQGAKTVTPGTSNQTAVASGRYTTGDVVVSGDANLKAENIAEGVSIFGVTGTHSGGGGGGYSSVEFVDESTFLQNIERAAGILGVEKSHYGHVMLFPPLVCERIMIDISSMQLCLQDDTYFLYAEYDIIHIENFIHDTVFEFNITDGVTLNEMFVDLYFLLYS